MVRDTSRHSRSCNRAVESRPSPHAFYQACDGTCFDDPSMEQEEADECKALLREKLSVLLKAEKLHPVVTLQQAASVEQALKACFLPSLLNFHAPRANRTSDPLRHRARHHCLALVIDIGPCASWPAAGAGADAGAQSFGVDAQTLASRRILSAPVLSEDNEICGFLDIRDILSSFLDGTLLARCCGRSPLRVRLASHAERLRRVTGADDRTVWIVCAM